VAALAVGFVLWALEHRAMLRLQRENQALRQQAEEAASLAVENERLAKQLAGQRSPGLPAPALPAPPTMVGDAASEPVDAPGSTNLFALISHGGNPPDLTAEQIETYLKENNHSAASLLTAFRATKDTNLLAEALEKYPHDPQVNYVSIFSSSSPGERRQRVEAFKQSAPDNALGNYLCALDYLRAGQNDLAIQELSAASSKGNFSDYSLEFVQNAEEAWRAAGYSVADSKTIASMELVLPDLKELRDLGRNTVALAASYQQAGDDASANALLRMNINLGTRFNGAPGEALISQLVGIAIESDSLRAMSPAAEYAPGQTVEQRLDDLARQRTELKDLASGENLLENMPSQDVISYWDRWRGFGSESTLRWAADKYGVK
jgi:hypothetical protein